MKHLFFTSLWTLASVIVGCSSSSHTTEEALLVSSLLETGPRQAGNATPSRKPSVAVFDSGDVIYGMIAIRVQRLPAQDQVLDVATVAIYGKDADGRRVVNQIYVEEANIEAFASGDPVKPLRNGPLGVSPLGFFESQSAFKGSSSNLISSGSWRWPTRVTLSRDDNETQIIEIELGPELDLTSGEPKDGAQPGNLIVGGTFEVECIDTIKGLIDPMFRNTEFCRGILAEAPSLTHVSMSLTML